MKKILLILLSYLFAIQVNASSNNVLGIPNSQLRRWEVDLDDIPTAIKSLIDFFLGIAATISVIFIIVWAYKILFWSLQQDKTKWRDTIIAALWWLAIALLAWVIINLIIDNLS